MPTRRHCRLPHLDSSQVAAALFGEVAAAPAAQRRPGPAKPSAAAANKKGIAQRSEQNRLDKLGLGTMAGEGTSAPLGARNGGAGGASSRRGSSDGAGGRAAPRPSKLSHSGRDFVRENTERVQAAARRRRSSSDSEHQQQHMHQPGAVPGYLIRRKMELAAQYAEQLAEKERALIPPGMRICSEEERLATLARLQLLHEQGDRELQALPFVAATVSQRRHQEQIEARLAELDAAIRVFSRPKVLVEA